MVATTDNKRRYNGNSNDSNGGNYNGNYKSMPFGLKNAGATYQRAIQTCLGNQVRRIAKAYINDVVIKKKRTRIIDRRP